ncbi:MAG: M48 family metalloprotease [Gammaproteobacteria bacterium]|nr:M48 family metalloprotease [Gammaproteobacteria bacterium]
MATGCATMEWEYGKPLPRVKSEKERAQEQHQTITRRIGIYDDPTLAQYVRTIGGKIASVSERPDLDWTFTILDSPVANAYATEAGYVYITRGLLAFLRSEDELAAVLAHETAHICNRDLLHRNIRDDSTAIGLLLAAPVLLFLPPSVGEAIVSPISVSFAAVDRKTELNADKNGAEYLRRAGYRPEAMVATLGTLKTIEVYEQDRAKAAGGATSGKWHRLFRTHPDADERQNKQMKTNENTATTTTVDSDFMKRLSGLVIGAPKTDGIPFGQLRYFPQKTLAVEVPKGWIAHDGEKGLWVGRKVLPSNPRQILPEGILIEKLYISNQRPACESLAKWIEPKLLMDPKPMEGYLTPSCIGVVDEPYPSLFGEKKHHYYSTGFVAEDNNGGHGFIFKSFPPSERPASFNPDFLAVVRSSITIKDKTKQPKPLALRVDAVESGESFASLAQNNREKEGAENLLRAINHRYPDGEPQAGELIKIIE